MVLQYYLHSSCTAEKQKIRVVHWFHQTAGDWRVYSFRAPSGHRVYGPALALTNLMIGTEIKGLTSCEIEGTKIDVKPQNSVTETTGLGLL